MIPGAVADRVVDELLALPPDVRMEALRAMPARDAETIYDWLAYDWKRQARPKQLPPSGWWRWWILMAGRSFGKTLTGAQYVRSRVESGEVRWVSICGPTAGTVWRDMLSGPTGLLSISPPWFMPEHQPSKLQLLYPPHPRTGARARVALLSADAPERIRGSQAEVLWCDEPQSWAKAEEAMSMLDLGLRLGPDPRGVVTMTPKPTPFVRDLVLGAKGEDGERRLPEGTVVVRGHTFENDTLDGSVVAALKAKYEGTRLGAQELGAEILDRPERAVFTQDVLDRFRVPGVPTVLKVVVAIDPSRSQFGTGDEAGGVVVALGEDGDVYVCEDCSVRGTPLEWMQHFAAVYNRYRAELGIYEQNRLDPGLRWSLLDATRGQKWEGRQAEGNKLVRLEPVAAAAQAGRIHLVGNFPELEEQLVGFDPTMPKGQLDDRLDAMVWGCRELLGDVDRTPMRLVP